MLLGALPKTFQDGATKLLHNHLKNSSNTSVVSASAALVPLCTAMASVCPSSTACSNSQLAYSLLIVCGCPRVGD